MPPPPTTLTADAGPVETEARQPYLHELVSAVRAPVVAVSDHAGQIRGGATGFYAHDRRLLCHLVVTLDAREPDPVLGHPVGADTARFLSAVRHLGNEGADPTVFLSRHRHVTAHLVEETITLVSRARHPVHTRLGITLASDLLTMGAVKAGREPDPRPATHLSADRVLWRGADELGAVAELAPPCDEFAEHPEHRTRLSWQLTLSPGATHTITVAVHTVGTGATPSVVAPPVGPPAFSAPHVRCDDHRLVALLDQSTADLGALLLADPAAPDDQFLAAGAPWYLTLFGRDSLWAARMLLPLGTNLAAGTLRTLARRQGTGVDARTAEEPGKILHEIRPAHPDAGDGALPATYYGTVDATPLWITLLHDAWRWGMPTTEVEALLPTMIRALQWLADCAAETGFLTYNDHTGAGLSNQGWKDSSDSIQFADGRLAEAPVALSEVQAYAYEAALHGATLLEAFDRPGADRWREWAHRLATRFRDVFWVDDPDGAYPAIALDRHGHQVDTVTSNIGHLLGTGLLNPTEDDLVVARLSSPELNCGYGLRTMSSAAHGYNPLSYHGGSVWSHDTAIAITGLARTPTGAASSAAAQLIGGLLRAAEAFHFRLPELHAGETALPGYRPAPYPAACRPQAWSASAAIVLVHTILGLTPDLPNNHLRITPMRPSPVGALTITGLIVGAHTLDLHLHTTGDVDILAAPSELHIDII